MDSTTEYWVWYGEVGSEQARVIARFDDIKKCREWCEREFEAYDVIGPSFPSIHFPFKKDDNYTSVLIGEVEDFTES